MDRARMAQWRDEARKVARGSLPACLQEQALVDYFRSRHPEVSQRVGRPIDLVRQKPYTGTQNAGYMECQEFFDAIALESEEPLGRQIVTVLDVAARGASGSLSRRWLRPGKGARRSSSL